jgi:DNA-binding MarR family transcriptional regulator
VTGVRASARSIVAVKRSVARVRARPAHRTPSEAEDTDTQRLLKHWRDAVPDDRFAHLVKDATRALVRALQRRLARFGVPFGHWAFLRILWESDGLTQRELSREAGVMEPTTFGALKAMESRGYIARRRLAGNRRKIHIFLTRKGRALKNKLVPLAEELNRIAVRGVPARDLVATRHTLLAVLESLARDEAGAAANPPPNEPKSRQAHPARRSRGRS